MRILLTGASGMLANDVIKTLTNQGHELVLTDFRPRYPEIHLLDVTNKDDVFRQVGESKADYIFHLAAETDVDLCEKDKPHAYMTNTEGTINMVDACREFDLPLLYISTSSVFPGDKIEPYVETDTPAPVNVYAKSKLDGEEYVKHNLKRYFILRAGWMIGGWELDKKFVFKIILQLKSGKKELRVVSDKFGSPTFTKDFAANIMNVIETNKYGLYHMANKGTCSRYDIALKIVECMGLSNEVKVHSISSDEFPLPAPRPHSEMVSNAGLEKLGINHMPPWEDSLKEYLDKNLEFISDGK